MAQDEIIQLLKEIKELQQKQLDLFQESLAQSEEQSKEYDKKVKRARVSQLIMLVLLALFFAFVFYAEWFSNGNPKPSWMN